MADIAAGNVTYTLVRKYIREDSMRGYLWTVAFGNGSLTYPSGGIPLTKASMGCPNSITNAQIYSPASADGLLYKYDQANNKIRIYRSGGFTPAGTVAAPTVSSDSAGTPAGSVAAPTVSSDSAGTPAGTVAAPTFTGSALTTHQHDFTITKGAVGSSLELGLSADAAAGTVNNNTISATLGLTTNTPIVAGGGVTPAGTNSAPAFTGSALAGHTHTAGAPAFTGSALAGHSHTAGTPAFTGTAVAAGSFVELSGGSTAVAAATLYMEVIGF